MIIIRSTAKKVLVFKALGEAPIRVFPGSNKVDDRDSIEDLKPFLHKNKAATAMWKENCSIIGKEDADMEQAEISFQKNKTLNNAYVVIKKHEKTIEENKAAGLESEKIMKEMAETMSSMKARIEELELREKEANEAKTPTTKTVKKDKK